MNILLEQTGNTFEWMNKNAEWTSNLFVTVYAKIVLNRTGKICRSVILVNIIISKENSILCLTNV